MTAMSEADVQGPVVDALRACGWRWVHFRPAQTQGGRWMTPYTGDDGFPDIVALKNGRLLVLEIKGARGAKKPGPNVRSLGAIEKRLRYEAQELWLEEFALAGAYAVFVTPGNLDEVLDVISARAQ